MNTPFVNGLVGKISDYFHKKLVKNTISISANQILYKDKQIDALGYIDIAQFNCIRLSPGRS